LIGTIFTPSDPSKGSFADPAATLAALPVNDRTMLLMRELLMNLVPKGPLLTGAQAS
jgi:hypothetical protein